MARRITRKQLKEDEFVSAVDTVFQWFVDNWRPIVAGIVAVCAAALLWWVGSAWSGSRSDAASYLLHEATSTAATDPTGLAAAEEQLQEVVDRYGSTDQGDIARLYLAQLRLEQGEQQSARDLLLQVSERQRQSPLGVLATSTLLELRTSTGQVEEVQTELQAMATGAETGLPRDAALFRLGELAFERQELDTARDYYQKLVDDVPNSPYAQTARQRLSELGPAR